MAPKFSDELGKQIQTRLGLAIYVGRRNVHLTSVSENLADGIYRHNIGHLKSPTTRLQSVNGVTEKPAYDQLPYGVVQANAVTSRFEETAK